MVAVLDPVAPSSSVTSSLITVSPSGKRTSIVGPEPMACCWLNHMYDAIVPSGSDDVEPSRCTVFPGNAIAVRNRAIAVRDPGGGSDVGRHHDGHRRRRGSGRGIAGSVGKSVGTAESCIRRVSHSVSRDGRRPIVGLADRGDSQ